MKKTILLMAGFVVLAILVACDFTHDISLATTDNEQPQLELMRAAMRRPVFAGGWGRVGDSKTGPAWVIDGYYILENGIALVHKNLGWEGRLDGWYRNDTFALAVHTHEGFPPSSGTTLRFQYDMRIIPDITPTRPIRVYSE